jgi:hypothetical protein
MRPDTAPSPLSCCLLAYLQGSGELLSARAPRWIRSHCPIQPSGQAGAQRLTQQGLGVLNQALPVAIIVLKLLPAGEARGAVMRAHDKLG